MSNYTPPKDWPVIRWVALAIVVFCCWYLSRGMAREAGNAIARVSDVPIIWTIGYMATYFGVMIVSFISVGIPAMAVIEGFYKWARNE